MKKLLGLFAILGLSTISLTTVVACNNTKNINSNEEINLGEINNIYPDTILNAYKTKVNDVDITKFEVFDYNQTSAKLVEKKSTNSSRKFEPIVVNFTLKPISLDDTQTIVTNILAGHMDENGIIDQSYTMEKLISDKAITSNSIRTSFAAMNGIYLNESDLEISDVDYSNNFPTVTLTSKNQNILKGENVVLSLNSEINSADLFRVTDVGNIYLPEELFVQANDLFDGSSEEANAWFAYSILFQNLGARNPLFAYLTQELHSSSLGIITKANENLTENMKLNLLKINLAWEKGWDNSLIKNAIISAKSATTEITYKIVEDDRMILGDYKNGDFIISEEAYNTKNITQIISEVYNQTNDQFKNGVSLEMFGKYTKIHFVEDDKIPTIEIIPGGEYVYGYDLLAFSFVESYFKNETTVKKYTPALEGTNPGYKLIIRPNLTD